MVNHFPWQIIFHGKSFSMVNHFPQKLLSTVNHIPLSLIFQGNPFSVVNHFPQYCTPFSTLKHFAKQYLLHHIYIYLIDFSQSQTFVEKKNCLYNIYLLFLLLSSKKYRVPVVKKLPTSRLANKMPRHKMT